MLYILIPVYNEAPNLRDLIINIKKTVNLKNKVLIVDDGSTDNTIEILKELQKKFEITRLGYKKNRGAGYAFKFGFNFLIPKLSKNDLVATMEGDNTTDYKIIKKMLDLSKKYDVVLASPHAKGGRFKGVTKSRILLSQIAAQIDSQIFRVKNVKTYSSFFRIYSASILKNAYKAYGKRFITHNGFSAAVEILLKLNKIGAKMIEIPSLVNWTKRKGKSKMNLSKNIKGHFILYKELYLKKFS